MILIKLLLYKIWRKIGWPKLMPLNLTISPSFLCNSRCRTCFAWQKKISELSLMEWTKIFHSLGKNPLWVTISGGEPFLRKDLSQLVIALYKICRPKIINIPSNGILTNKIFKDTKKILKNCPKTQIIINLSLDGIGEDHNKIRGIAGNFQKTLNTFSVLRKIKAQNFTLGIHTVISVFNVDKIPQIYSYVCQNLKPDSYITEIAEERMELGTIGQKIIPDLKKYFKILDFLIQKIPQEKWSNISKITQAFRMEYYHLVKRTLEEKKQIIPCYAGFASAQIVSNGEVWPCCIKAQNLGNLKKTNFDFKKVWFSKKADLEREKIKQKKCFCPLANVSYTNMILNFGSLFKILKNFWKLL